MKEDVRNLRAPEGEAGSFDRSTIPTGQHLTDRDAKRLKSLTGRVSAFVGQVFDVTVTESQRSLDKAFMWNSQL